MSVLNGRSRKLLVIAALLLLVLSSVISTIFFDSSKEGSLGQRLDSQHSVIGVQTNDVLFVGDDLIAEGLWTELIPAYSARNRGLNGETSSQLIQRVVPLAAAKPRQIYLNVGANDVLNQVPQDRILSNYRELLNLINAFSPDTEIFIMSALPLSPDNISAIENLNLELAQLASHSSAVFINLAQAMLNEEGRYKPGLADHRMRLLGQGYELWRELINPHLGIES